MKIGLLVVLFFGVFAAIVMLLWNWLMPELFGLPLITFWKALGLLVLFKILFSGFRRHHGHGPPWRNHWQQKWKNMPDHKKQEWKQKFTDKWCHSEKHLKDEDYSKEDE